MNNPAQLDVMIVYSGTMVSSPKNNRASDTAPFPPGSRNASYSEVYGYFLEVCRRQGLRAALCSSADIVDAGVCSCFWTYKNKKWIKNGKPCFSRLIFDKFSPTRRSTQEQRKLMFSSGEIRPFRDPAIFRIFFDKQLTYERLPKHAIPTVAVKENTLEGVSVARAELGSLLDQHPLAGDFGDAVVMKDRFGAGGRRVYKFSEENTERLQNIIRRNRKVSFVIQPFVRFDQGFSHENRSASTDIRLVFLGGKIVQSYIRIAKENDFRCNEHQGGSLVYVPIGDIPDSLIAKAGAIVSKLKKTDSLFALDFIVSNNGNIYLLEGNTGPGLDWNVKLKKNEKEAKRLIRLVVSELLRWTNKKRLMKRYRRGVGDNIATPGFSYLAST